MFVDGLSVIRRTKYFSSNQDLKMLTFLLRGLLIFVCESGIGRVRCFDDGGVREVHSPLFGVFLMGRIFLYTDISVGND